MGVPYPNVGGPGRDFSVRNSRPRRRRRVPSPLPRDEIRGLHIDGVHGTTDNYIGLLDRFGDEGGSVRAGPIPVGHRRERRRRPDGRRTGRRFPPRRPDRPDALQERRPQPMDVRRADVPVLTRPDRGPPGDRLLGRRPVGHPGHLHHPGRGRHGRVPRRPRPRSPATAPSRPSTPRSSTSPDRPSDQAQVSAIHGIKNVFKWTSGRSSTSGSTASSRAAARAGRRRTWTPRSPWRTTDATAASCSTAAPRRRAEHSYGSWQTGQFTDLPATVGPRTSARSAAGGFVPITAYTPDLGCLDDGSPGPRPDGRRRDRGQGGPYPGRASGARTTSATPSRPTA